MGGALAEMIARRGHDVTLVRPSALVSVWTLKALDQPFIHQRLVGAGVKIRLTALLAAAGADRLELACFYTGAPASLDCAALVLVTSRLPKERLTLELLAREAEWADAGIASVKAIGDCRAPATIAAAVFAGHRYAREFGETVDPDAVAFKRERIVVG